VKLADLAPSGIAVVTGASTGIGRALAALLAQRGHNLMLVAPPGESLADYARSLGADHAATVQARELDLTDRARRDELLAELRGLEVSVLCNNAGVGRFGRYTELDNAAEIELNVVTVSAINEAVLPGMIERRRGAVLLTGSTAGNAPTPLAATYSASKAFVNALGEALHLELRDYGVTCTVLVPGPVRSAFGDRAGAQDAAAALPGWSWISAEDAARAGLDGLDRGTARVAPGWQGRLIDTGSRLVPRRFAATTVHAALRRYFG
jgi:short-subunit dehydrogenase